MDSKLLLISFIFLIIVLIGWNHTNKTSDFQFHYQISKGICISNYEQSYCDSYYLISKLLNFPNEFSQYLFYSFLFFFVLPLLVCITIKQTLIYFSFGFSYNIFYASIFPQGLGLFLIFYFFKTENNWTKTFIILLSIFIHKFLTVFLILIYGFHLLDSFIAKQKPAIHN